MAGGDPGGCQAARIGLACPRGRRWSGRSPVDSRNPAGSRLAPAHLATVAGNWPDAGGSNVSRTRVWRLLAGPGPPAWHRPGGVDPLVGNWELPYPTLALYFPSSAFQTH